MRKGCELPGADSPSVASLSLPVFSQVPKLGFLLGLCRKTEQHPARTKPEPVIRNPRKNDNPLFYPEMERVPTAESRACGVDRLS